jgi:hypothetical protein
MAWKGFDTDVEKNPFRPFFNISVHFNFIKIYFTLAQ